MEKRRCYNCDRDYYVSKSDHYRAYNERSPWLDDVCKRCTCLLLGYHKWTITDAGGRVCGYCFLRRFPMGRLVDRIMNKRLEARKRELDRKKVRKANESP
jgi:hypothetical protein